MPDRKESAIYLGLADAASYGYQRPLKVYAHIALGRQSDYGTPPREKETTDHRTVVDPIELSVTFSVRKTWKSNDSWVSCGAMGESGLAEVKIRQCTPEQWERVARLIPWHLNGMQAGCDHQTIEYETDPYGRTVPSLDRTPPCPVTGYRYGHAWLVRELPAEIIADAVALGATVPADRTDPAVIMAEEEASRA